MEIKCINSIYTDRNDVSSCFISVKRNINPIQIFLNIKKMIYICIQKEIFIMTDVRQVGVYLEYMISNHILPLVYNPAAKWSGVSFR